MSIWSRSRGPLQVTIEEEGRTRLKDRFVSRRRPRDICSASRPRWEIREKGTDGRYSGATAFAGTRSPQPCGSRGGRLPRPRLHSMRHWKGSALQQPMPIIWRNDCERLKNLYAKGSIAKDQMDQIEAEAKKARALQRSAQAAVNVSRSELERAKTAIAGFSSREENSRAKYRLCFFAGQRQYFPHLSGKRRSGQCR